MFTQNGIQKKAYFSLFQALEIYNLIFFRIIKLMRTTSSDVYDLTLTFVIYDYAYNA